MNPYSGKSFIGFISVFFHRLSQWVQGDLPLTSLASDEIQMLVLVIMSVATSLIGVFLVLRRMTMLANSLSHTVLLGIIVTYLIFSSFMSVQGTDFLRIDVLLIAAMVTGLLTTVLTQMMTQFFRLQEDASIGLVFTTLFALGVVLLTLFTRNAHIGTEVILGNVDALHMNDLKMIFWVALLDLLVIGAFFKEFQITAFDSSFANAMGISTNKFNYLLMVLTAATAIGAFRAVGVLLVLAFLVVPPLTARLLTHRLRPLICIAVALAIACSFCGVALSRHFLTVYHIPLSTGGLVVVLLAISFLLALTVNRARARTRVL
jgi:manganese/zinc/iron transport system permease protein